ncbi:hypothetical protein MJ561_01520 [Klebsiella pneumoniae]|nr:hypothetical protein MJ561_01520 [Klebsiella pneumoniae]
MDNILTDVAPAIWCPTCQTAYRRAPAGSDELSIAALWPDGGNFTMMLPLARQAYRIADGSDDRNKNAPMFR